MLIRFKKFITAGNVQFEPGQLLDLPEEVAQAHVDDGNAIVVPKAETASLRFENAPAFRFPVYRPSKKNRR